MRKSLTLAFLLVLGCYCATYDSYLRNPYDLTSRYNEPVLTGKLDSLQGVISGIWEGAGLSVPMTVIKCFDETLAGRSIDTISGVVSNAVTGNYETIHENLSIFMTGFPSSVQTCLKENKEVKELMEKLGFFSKSERVRISQLGVYVASNQSKIMLDLKLGLGYVKSGSWKLLGKTFVKTIIFAFH